jgi:acetylornithine aminotransferase
MEKKSLLKKAQIHESVIKSELTKLPGIIDVRGQGLLLGIVLAKENSPEVKDALLRAGVLVNSPGPSVIRIAPALTVTGKEVAKFISIFSKVLKEISHG